MNKFSVLFIETGFNINIPALRNRRCSVFPFWGNYKFIDFHVSQLNFKYEVRKILILNKKYFNTYNEIRARFYDTDLDLVQIENSLEEFLQILESLDVNKVIITSLSYIALYNNTEILKLVNKPGKTITKISINDTPVDMFIVNRKSFIGLLSKSILQSHWKDDFFNYLFSEILHSNFDEIINIGGRFIFSNTLVQLYKSNLWLIKNMNNDYILNTFSKIHDSNLDNLNSIITKYGRVVNSLICSGVEINGFVENSIIFPGVITKRNSRIVNSVIMNNNRIGSKAEIKNTLILPFYREFMKNINSIEDRAEIGSDDFSNAANSEFPGQIFGGLTVIGIDTTIGREFIVKPGCYAEGDFTVKNMGNEKILHEGVYISKKQKEV
jgi:ADP-glucose pyrophosphorylase